MADISQVKLPNGTTYNLKDNGALQLTGGTVTGPTIFENSVDIDEATVGDLSVTGAVTFTNYPTTIATSSGTNQLTLISNTKYVLTTPGGSFIFTTPVDNDTKVSTAAVTSETTYYPVVGANTTSAATKFYDSTGFTYTATNGTANGTNGAAVLVLGNNIASSTANWKAGKISLYGTTAYATTIVSGAPTAARTITLPNKDGTVALTSDLTWGTITSKPTATGSSTTGISIAAHGTGTVIGVQSSTTSVRGVKTDSTTTASKVTLGTAISIPNVTGNSDVTVPIAASSATTVPIKNSSATSVPVVSSNSDATLSFAMDTTDTKKLKISWSATPTRTVFGTATSIYGVQSSTTSVTGVSGSTTASKVTLGTAKSVPNVTAATDVTVPIRADADTTVPIKNTSSSTFVTGTTHTITDNGHTHTIS